MQSEFQEHVLWDFIRERERTLAVGNQRMLMEEITCNLEMMKTLEFRDVH